MRRSEIAAKRALPLDLRTWGPGQLPDPLPSFRSLEAVRRLSSAATDIGSSIRQAASHMGLHEFQQGRAGAIFSRHVALDVHPLPTLLWHESVCFSRLSVGQHSPCHLPLPLGVVLVAHVEKLEELYLYCTVQRTTKPMFAPAIH